MSPWPRPHPKEFRDDVVRVARNREDGVTIEQIAADFGAVPDDPVEVTPGRLRRPGRRPGRTTVSRPSCGNCVSRNPLLEQENEVPAPGGGVSVAVESAGKRLYPLVKELGADGSPSR